MAYLGVDAIHGELTCAGSAAPLDAALRRRLSATRPDSPIVILVHGYKFSPLCAGRNPHDTLYAFAPRTAKSRLLSWPVGLGFCQDDPFDGLCIGFAWPAVRPHLPALCSRGRTGFAEIYDEAGTAGRDLANLIDRINVLAPNRHVDILAHSLGGRVALAALELLGRAPGRVVLLGAAEFDNCASRRLSALRDVDRAEIYNVTARANDFYDFMFETFAPGGSTSGRAVGGGLPSCARLRGWIDIQIDNPRVIAWLRSRGISLAPARARICHWGFYTRAGAFTLYREIFRRSPGWDVAALRGAAALREQEPRWSRLHVRPVANPKDTGSLDLTLGGGVSRA